MKSLIFIFFTVLMISQSWAATPELSAIAGDISQGQTLVISGNNFLNENTSDWFMTLAESRCEGSTPVADGWSWQGGIVKGGYVEDVSLVGDKSLHLSMTQTKTVVADECPYANIGSAVYRSHRAPIVYARAYLRYSPSCEQLFDYAHEVKMFYWMQAGCYVQPYAMGAHGWPTQMWLYLNGTGIYPDLPEQWTNDRWYCIEAKADNTNDELTAWVDGELLGTTGGTPSEDPFSFLLGFINACPTPIGTFEMWADSIALSTSRIYPISLVEIGNNSVYATATKVTQELVKASETQLEIKCNLSGLGAGPYYLWVTNNRQERSNTYNVAGNDKVDTESPIVSIATPTSGQILSGTVTISSNATDNVGVAGVQFKLDGNNIGTEVINSPFSYSLDTTILSDGSYNLSAIARDAAGNQTTSGVISINIDNTATGGTSPAILFTETFDNADFAVSGWYDNTNLQLSTSEHIVGSSSSAEFHFAQGSTTPASGGAIRKKFTDTDEVYVKYHVKYSSNWTGSNQNYHPHEFMLLTNVDTDWSNLAYTHLTAYIEQNEGIPLLAIQDGQNIDETKIGIDLTNITEYRAVAGCNGDSDGFGNGECYSIGTVHRNGKEWRAQNVFFQDTTGAYYKNDWHTVEAYFKLNTISGGKAVADGQLKYWFDGNLIINHNNVILRTGQHPDMKFNQFVIAPYIGDGSPVDQTFWVDNLSVSSKRPLPPPKLNPFN